ncbi:MAG: alpha/beta hydrolase [Halobacteriovoraceae bacterium]|nr:alpha/beta hydrolase [Halobacteriovoraceae bacterium]MCB9095687.1 alpha/beta hydrolase [Halobacteriovoraceae bacterium]
MSKYNPDRNKFVKIVKTTLEHESWKVSALAFLSPHNELKKGFKAIFTHGYTASKSSVLPWASRLAGSGISSLIFDLPGHYLGASSEVEDFENFKKWSPFLFAKAIEKLKEIENYKNDVHYILGGHSLGALLTLKAFVLPELSSLNKTAVLVGLGLNQDVSTHFFETDFYQKTLNIRRQLVSPELDSDIVFPWIKNEKLNLKTTNENILLIVGEDDVVVGKHGAENLVKILGPKNKIELIKPAKLPHHLPENASTFVYNNLKRVLQW